MIGRVLGGCGGDGGFVMEAIEIASGFLKVLYPSLRLSARGRVSQSFSLLGQRILRGEEAYSKPTSAIIMWQSKVPTPCAVLGRLT